MTPVETLQGMRDLLAEPRRWTRHVRAKSATGAEVSPISRSATCWCIVGAYQKVAGLTSESIYNVFVADPAYIPLLAVPALILSGRTPWDFNDRKTHPEVIALIDAALTNAKKDANV